jgi:hypothetical protein
LAWNIGITWEMGDERACKLTSAALTLRGITPKEAMADVYFRPDFLELHSHPDVCDILDTGTFRHGSAVRAIPGSKLEDLETPHGYGGPSALDISSLKEGVSAWRDKQQRAGRVAEFIRLHPFLNGEALNGMVDYLEFNRKTVILDLEQSIDERWKTYSKGTRHALRHAEKNLTVRKLDADEWVIFWYLHQETLIRNAVGADLFFPSGYYKALLAKGWVKGWVAEKNNGPIAVAVFLSSTPRLCHYHLAGGTDIARETKANYLLLEHAFRHFAEQGGKWMHLGGGRSRDPEDPLYKFKSKFSKLRASFYIAGMIHDPKLYKALGGDQCSRFLGYRS